MATFPHFRHDNSADIQYLKIKFSGQAVTILHLGINITFISLLDSDWLKTVPINPQSAQCAD